MIKIVKDGYIVSLQKEGQHDIDYEEAVKVLLTMPNTEEGESYRLREDITWERYTIDENKQTDDTP